MVVGRHHEDVEEVTEERDGLVGSLLGADVLEHAGPGLLAD